MMVGPIGVCHRQSEARHALAVPPWLPQFEDSLRGAGNSGHRQKHWTFLFSCSTRTSLERYHGIIFRTVQFIDPFPTPDRELLSEHCHRYTGRAAHFKRPHCLASPAGQRAMDDSDRKLRRPLLDSSSIHSEQASEIFDSNGVPLGPNYGSFGGLDGTVEFAIPESRKIGVAGAVFLILNKMIGTGSMSSRFPSCWGVADTVFQSFPHHQASLRRQDPWASACLCGELVRTILMSQRLPVSDQTCHSRPSHTDWPGRLPGIRTCDPPLWRRKELPRTGVQEATFSGNQCVCGPDDSSRLLGGQLARFWPICAARGWPPLARWLDCSIHRRFVHHVCRQPTRGSPTVGIATYQRAGSLQSSRASGHRVFGLRSPGWISIGPGPPQL